MQLVCSVAENKYKYGLTKFSIRSQTGEFAGMDEVHNQIIRVLSGEQKPLMIKSIAEKCHLHPQTVARKLDTLEVLGRVRKIQMGHAKKYYLVDALRVSGLIDISSDFILIVNPGHIIQYINQSAEKFLGVQNRQIIGERLEILHLDIFSSPKVLAGLHTFSHEKIFRTQIPYLHEDSLRWYSIAIMALALKTNTYSIAIIVSDITAKWNAEKKLQESEAKYRFISENSSDVIWMLDVTSLSLVYVSPSVYDLTGYQSEEVLGISLLDFMIHPSELAILHAIPERITRFLAGDDSVRVRQEEVEHIHRDGTRIQSEMVTTLLHDEDGKVSRIIGVSRNITERKRSEEALQKSREQISILGDILKHSFQPIVVLKQDMSVDYCNTAFETLFGYVSEEIQNLHEIHPAGYLKWKKITRDITDQVNRTRNPVTCIHSFIRRDGREIYTEIVTHMIQNSQGEAIRYYAFLTDITERKRKEEEIRLYQDQLEQLVQERTKNLLEEIRTRVQTEKDLRISEERFVQVSELSGAWIWEIDRDGVFHYCSSGVQQVLGYLPEDLIGRTLFRYLSPDSCQEMEAIFKSVSTRKEYVRSLLMDMVHKNGSIIRVESDGLPIRDTSGAILGYRGIFTNVTEDFRVEHAILESRKYYRTLFENSPVPLLLIDADTMTCLDGNKEALEIFGCPSGTLKGQSVDVIFAPSGSREENMQAYIRRCVASGRIRCTVGFPRPDGAIWSGSVTLVPFEQRRKNQVLLCLQDP